MELRTIILSGLQHCVYLEFISILWRNNESIEMGLRSLFQSTRLLLWQPRKLSPEPFPGRMETEPRTPSTSVKVPLQVHYIRCSLAVVHVDLHMRLEDFKRLVGKMAGVPVDEQRIYQEGVLRPPCGCCRVYEDSQSLSHYDIREVRPQIRSNS